MAIVEVKFKTSRYIGNITRMANEPFLIDEKELKRFPKNDYEIISKPKKKKTKDIKAEDKETIDIET